MSIDALSIVFLFFGIVLSLFLFWKRFREDYDSEQIFLAGFLIIITSLLMSSLLQSQLAVRLPETNFFTPANLWFWGGFLGALLGILLAFFKLGFRFFETVEIVSISFLIFVSLVFLKLLITQKEALYLFGLAFIFLLFMLYNFLQARYKRFSWYKSGKVGFSGLTLMGLFFLVRGVVAFFYPTMLSLNGKIDAVLSFAVSFIFFFAVYNLAELD